MLGSVSCSVKASSMCRRDRAGISVTAPFDPGSHPRTVISSRLRRGSRARAPRSDLRTRRHLRPQALNNRGLARSQLGRVSDREVRRVPPLRSWRLDGDSAAEEHRRFRARCVHVASPSRDQTPRTRPEGGLASSRPSRSREDERSVVSQLRQFERASQAPFRPRSSFDPRDQASARRYKVRNRPNRSCSRHVAAMTACERIWTRPLLSSAMYTSLMKPNRSRL